MAEDDGFLSRWSRRKVVARSEEQSAPAPVPVPAPETEPEPSLEPATAAAFPLPSVIDGAAHPVVAQPESTRSDPEALTLIDVAKLTRDSDYSPFVARNVSPDVRNAALKQLFTDPHYNVMDGLDIYIDDYGKPDPLPEGMLRQMTQTAFLGLFDEPEPDEVLAQSSPQPSDPASPDDAVADTEADEDPDLRLQPDDAPGRSGPDTGPDEDQRRER